MAAHGMGFGQRGSNALVFKKLLCHIFTQSSAVAAAPI
jgi:hypothetical protein